MTELAKAAAKAIASIRKFVASPRGVSKFALCRRAGLSPNTLRDMDEPGWKPKPETLDKALAAIAQLKAERASRPLPADKGAKQTERRAA